jgi:N-acyl-D-aspartate/D-glutamate deacylase
VAEPGDGRAQPPNIQRRKLLLAAGFVGANVVVLNRLGRGQPTAAPTQTVRVQVAGEQISAPPSLANAAPAPPTAHVFDRVISNGRVIDPDTGYDAVANVGIDGDRITSISTETLTGRATTDASGLVVAPGFIDVLSYEPNSYGVWYKVGDGVTTNLGMHGLNSTAEEFFDTYGSDAQRPPVHYGGAFDDPHMRSVVEKLPSKAATSAQLSELQASFENAIANGYIGLDVEPEYTPWVTTDEITALATVAAEHGMPVFSHIRASSPDAPDGGSLGALDELLQVADQSGAAVHVDHITSMTTHVMSQAIERIDAARDRGVDVTACLYPYDFWATTLASERFADGWQQRFGIDYDDLEVAGTGERLTAATFQRYQDQNKLVAAHAIPEADVQAALRTPWTMIGSDAILEPGDNNHPRCSGCFTRTLGRYVRELGVLTLVDALAKMTIQPARRLEARVPALQTKGRLQIGADADITIFDAATVGDRSTIADPAQMAVGIQYVLVSGQLVKDGDTMNKDVRPGQPIRGATA